MHISSFRPLSENLLQRRIILNCFLQHAAFRSCGEQKEMDDDKEEPFWPKEELSLYFNEPIDITEQ